MPGCIKIQKMIKGAIQIVEKGWTIPKNGIGLTEKQFATIRLVSHIFLISK